MAGASSEGTADELCDLVDDLYKKGERCAAAGLLAEAAALMEQASSIARAIGATGIASSAAWEAGWLYIRAGNHQKASELFSLVRDPVTPNATMWPAAVRALVDLCLAVPPRDVRKPAADRSPDPTLAPAARQQMPDLTVSNLGRFQITRGGEVLPNPTFKKPVALFRYLLTRPRHSASKEELIDLFWPDSSPRDAAHSLHTAVSYLRGHLDPPSSSYLVFESGSDSYMLNPNVTITDDSTTFQESIDLANHYYRTGDHEGAREHYVQGLARYTGDYYVDASDTIWAVAKRESLLTRYLIALDHLGQLYIDQQQFELAIDTYEQLLARDSYREDIHGQLIRCYLSLGRRGAALRQYDACATILHHDLGLQPSPELQNLYHSIAAPPPPIQPDNQPSLHPTPTNPPT